MQREGVWVFFLFFTVYLLLLLYLLTSWKRLTRSWIRRNYGKTSKRRKQENDNVVKTFVDIYSRAVGVEKGKFFLWKLYLIEFVENGIQLYNMQTIYLCTLPLGWTIILSTILIGESSYRAYTMAKRLWLSNSKQISVVDKNLQYGLDIVVDTFFLLVPLTIIVLWYDV